MDVVMLGTSAVGGLTGASPRQLGHWARTGLLKPSGRESAGRGTRRLYTFPDVVAALTIVQLRAKGCPLQRVRAAVRYLRAHFPSASDAQMLARLTLMTDGQRVYMLVDRDAVMDVVTRQHVWSVALGQLILQARQQVDKLPAEWVQDVVVEGRTYHLIVSRDPEAGGFVVQCQELPGALEQGETAAEAIASGKEAIASVVAFQQRIRGQRGARHVQAG